jgi:integrase
MAKMVRKLTARTVDGAKPRYTQYELSDGEGLFLSVYPSGIKSWVFRYRRPNRKSAKMTIGTYPAFPLSVARDVAAEARRRVAELGDPGRDKAKAKAAAGDTGDLTGAWLDRYVAEFLTRKAATYRYNASRVVNKRLRPDWEDRRIGTITGDDVHDVVDASAGPAAQNFTRAVAGSFFKWVLKQKRAPITVSPAANVARPNDPGSRDRVLSLPEIAAVWAATASGSPFDAFVRLLLLTGQRRNEVAGMRWAEITNLDGASPLWTVPAERAKNGQPNPVPLAPAAVTIIRGVHRWPGSDFVLSNTGAKPLCGFPKFKTMLDARCPLSKSWVLQDLRRSLSTGMNEAGVDPWIVESILNHKGHKAGVAGIYNHARYLVQKRAALETWAGTLQV